ACLSLCECLCLARTTPPRGADVRDVLSVRGPDGRARTVFTFVRCDLCPLTGGDLENPNIIGTLQRIGPEKRDASLIGRKSDVVIVTAITDRPDRFALSIKQRECPC